MVIERPGTSDARSGRRALDCGGGRGGGLRN